MTVTSYAITMKSIVIQPKERHSYFAWSGQGDYVLSEICFQSTAN